MIGFLFPGQGSQQVGMGADICRDFTAARQVYRQAEELLKIPVRKLSFEGPADELTRTANAQPAILVHSAAVLAVLSGAGHRPALVAGHSLGELSALYAAGVFDFESALRLAGERGRLMERAGGSGDGVMVAVLGLEADQVRTACEQAVDCGPVVLANDNAPLVSVVSGVRQAVDRAVELCREMGKVRTVELAVGGAFHSPLMEKASTKWTAAVEAVPMQPPQALVFGNVTAAPLGTVEEVKAELTAQITATVRWREISARIIEQNPGLLVELGPGNTLRGLIVRWLRHQADPAMLSRWTESIHLTGTASELRATLQALDSYSQRSSDPEPPPSYPSL